MSSKSENEHEFSEEKDSSQAESSEAGKSCGLEAYDTNNIVGTKIEAQDFDGKWHPARVAEFDTSENEILIHYENWNSKFDEWIPMDSSRLRLMPQSEPECITQPSIEGVKFAKGEQVIAQWSVNQKYPGTIQSVLSNDRYEVLFYDGFLKRLKSQKISKMSGGVIQNEIKNFADIGTKEERRERKRKINVAELFHINKRSKKKGLIHANPPEVKTYAVNRSRARNSSIGKNDAASPMSPTCTGASETGEVTSPATVDNSPVTTVVTPTTLTLDSEPRTTTGTILASDIETVNNSVESPAPKAERKVTTQSHSSKAVLHSVPTAVEVKYRDGRTATWTKQMYQRSEGRTAGKIDIIIINPQGRKFRSRTEIMKYCEENGIIYSHDAFDFSAKGRPKSKSIVQVKTETSSNEVDNNIAKPLSNASLEASLASSASTLAPVSAPALLPPPHSHPGIRSQLLTTVPIEQHDPQENKVFIGDVEVLTDNGKLICPDKKCAKHFRRENLLHMHMKHYHPEFSKYLDYTPSVTDLAYARTVGSLEPIDGPQQASRKSLNAERYERTPNKSDHARRASSSVIEGSRETKKSTFKTDVKVEMKSPLQSLKSTSNTVVSPTVDINQECTEENDSNKAVDNSETFKDTLQQNSFTQTTNESAEPNLEQACFEANSNADSILQTHATYRSAKSNRHHRSRKTNRFQGSFSGHIRRRKYGGRDHRRSNYKISKRQLETQIQQPEIEEPTEQPQPQLHQQQQQQPQQEQLLQQQPQTQPPSISSSLTEDQSNSNTSSHAFATSRCQKQLIAPNEISDNAEGTEDSKSPLTVENEKVEKLRRNEIINCVCGLSEEDGLMIQCDICLCWQHGHCAQILRDSDVPDKYICSICKNPFRGRSSMKYIHDQDWLKEGNLPSLSFRSKREDVINQRRGILKRSHDLSGSISLLSQVIHSLRVKVNIAEKKDHPKLWLWAKKWNEKKPSRLKDVDMKPDNLAACNVDVNGDIKVEGSLGEEQLVPKAPEPEAPIDSAECRLNLLDHLVHYQSLVDARLSYIENLVAELESMQEDAADDETAERYPRTKATVQMILRDLNTMKKIAAIS